MKVHVYGRLTCSGRVHVIDRQRFCFDTQLDTLKVTQELLLRYMIQIIFQYSTSRFLTCLFPLW
jgi:hypothetical protein